MFPFRRIFIADLSSALDLDLLRYGAGVAALHRGSEVTIGALPSPQVLQTLVPSSRAIFASCDEAEVACRVLVEPDVDSLFAVASECRADVLLVRHPHRRPDGRQLARRIVTESPCSVWLVPDGAGPRLRSVAAQVGPAGVGTKILRLACALGREARAEALHAIHVSFAPLLATLDELRERKLFELSCTMARMDVGDMECTLHVDDSPYASRALCRAASRQDVDLLVAAAPSQGPFGLVWNRSDVDDLIAPARSALLGIRLPGPGFWGAIHRVLTAPDPKFN
jgi:hypothetical protein